MKMTSSNVTGLCHFSNNFYKINNFIRLISSCKSVLPISTKGILNSKVCTLELWNTILKRRANYCPRKLCGLQHGSPTPLSQRTAHCMEIFLDNLLFIIKLQACCLGKYVTSTWWYCSLLDSLTPSAPSRYQLQQEEPDSHQNILLSSTNSSSLL